MLQVAFLILTAALIQSGQAFKEQDFKVPTADLSSATHRTWCIAVRPSMVGCSDLQRSVAHH